MQASATSPEPERSSLAPRRRCGLDRSFCAGPSFRAFVSRLERPNRAWLAGSGTRGSECLTDPQRLPRDCPLAARPVRLRPTSPAMYI